MAPIPAVPDMRLELVPVPVSDVDRAKEFYERAGFGNMHDTQVTETMRVVQLTPPGSSCAIVFGTAMGPITPSSCSRLGRHRRLGAAGRRETAQGGRPPD
jgi:hypothetical protein